MKNIKDLKFVAFFLQLSKKQKIIFISLFCVLILSFLSLIIFQGLPKKSKSFLYFEDSDIAEKILYKNKSAKFGNVKQNNSAIFKFTENQTELLRDFYKKNKDFTIASRIEIKNAQKQDFSLEKKVNFSFLYKTDFDSKGKFLTSGVNRIFCSVNLSELVKNEKTVFDLGLASSKNFKNDEIPCGIEIFSDANIKIYDFLVTKARVGFDFTDSIPFFGSSYNGGKVFTSQTESDFTGSLSTFSSQWTKNSSMPYFELEFLPLTDYGTSENPARIKMNIGGEILTVYRTKSVSSCVIQTSTLNNPFSFCNFNQSEGQILKFLLKSNDDSLMQDEILLPLKTDLGLILKTKTENWRNSEYELYEWDRFPGILFFDFKNYDIQGKFLTRLAYFSEKKGFKGQILKDFQIEGKHGYNAHDYSSETLASFFTKAQNLNVLNEKEKLLCRILLKNGVIIQTENGFKPGKGAVISISKESADYNRRNFTAHESWHGIFFINEDFRNATSAVYYTIDPTSLAFLTEYWQSQGSLGYDTSDIYLMNNEFMAYIMQQPLSSVADYFVHLANRGSVMNAIPELCEYVRNTKGKTFEDAARIFESYAFDNFGLACGRVHLITR